jgi:nicotinamide riboside kinase
VDANRILFCDTDAITTQIYSEHYLGVIPDVLFDLEKKTKYDHYFLLHPDVPWVADGLRDLGAYRKEMFNIFKSALDKRKIPYTDVKGTFEERFEVVSNIIDALLATPIAIGGISNKEHRTNS